jgi:hypothetical protein
MYNKRYSIESQLRTKCNILESQVEVLIKKIPVPKNLEISDNLQVAKWKEVSGIGKFPA